MLISKGCSKEFALGVVVETMINENEFRNIVNGLKRSLKENCLIRYFFQISIDLFVNLY